jgi:hypothetical protein
VDGEVLIKAWWAVVSLGFVLSFCTESWLHCFLHHTLDCSIAIIALLVVWALLRSDVEMRLKWKHAIGVLEVQRRSSTRATHYP